MAIGFVWIACGVSKAIVKALVMLADSRRVVRILAKNFCLFKLNIVASFKGAWPLLIFQCILLCSTFDVVLSGFDTYFH